MKKSIIFVFIIALALSLVACKVENDNSNGISVPSISSFIPANRSGNDDSNDDGNDDGSFVLPSINNYIPAFGIDSDDEEPVLSDANDYDPLNNRYEPILVSDKSISRTFMMYIVGSDLETQSGLATNDIIEIMGADIDFEWNNMLIKAGGAKQWANDVFSSKNTDIYEIGEGGIRCVNESPAQNMASPDTLTNFLTFCYENYKTDAYSLILWDHGSGPVFGFGYDELSGDMLSLSDLVKAIDSSPFGADNKLEFIGFDACLMGSIETAFAFKDYANYLVSSQESIPGWGWEYSFLSEVTPKTTTEGIAVAIIDSYFEISELLFSIRPDFTTDITMSCLNLGNLSMLEGGLNSLYSIAGESLDSATFPAAALVRNTAKEFGTTNTNAHLDLVDMRHLCDLMSNQYLTEAQNLSDALNGLIVYNRANIPNVGGVSIYFPYREKEMLDILALFYTSFGFADDYAGYIQKFVGLLQDKPTIDWNMSKAIFGQESSTEYFVQLTPEQVATYASASFYVLIKNGEKGDTFYGNYIIFNSSDVTLNENGKLIANYEGKMQLMLDPETGETLIIQMIEQEVTDTYVRYYLPTILWSNIYDGNSAIADIQIQTDRDGSNIKVLSVIRRTDYDNPHLMNREIIDIYEYSYLTIVLGGGKEPTYNNDGSLKPFDEWHTSSSAIGSEIRLNSETKDSLVFIQEEVDKDAECFMVINIKDVYGNVVSSDIIPVG